MIAETIPMISESPFAISDTSPTISGSPFVQFESSPVSLEPLFDTFAASQ